MGEDIFHNYWNEKFDPMTAGNECALIWNAIIDEFQSIIHSASPKSLGDIFHDFDSSKVCCGCKRAFMDQKMKSCPYCRTCKFCSRECQKKNWKFHQLDCRKSDLKEAYGGDLWELTKGQRDLRREIEDRIGRDALRLGMVLDGYNGVGRWLTQVLNALDFVIKREKTKEKKFLVEAHRKQYILWLLTILKYLSVQMELEEEQLKKLQSMVVPWVMKMKSRLFLSSRRG